MVEVREKKLQVLRTQGNEMIKGCAGRNAGVNDRYDSRPGDVCWRNHNLLKRSHSRYCCGVTSYPSVVTSVPIVDVLRSVEAYTDQEASLTQHRRQFAIQ